MKIFYDVDTQNDFMNKDGALYVPDAELIKPNLKLLTLFAREKSMKVFGSVDRHFGTERWKDYEGELKKWVGPFPDHCMDGTKGQRKINETNSRKTLFVINSAPDEGSLGEFTALAMRQIINSRSPVIFEKQGYSVFPTEDCPGGNKYAEWFLKEAGMREAVVYGVATDFCVKAAVLGMQKRGIQTYIIEDAVKGVFPESTKSALEEMATAGAQFVKTADVLEGRV